MREMEREGMRAGMREKRQSTGWALEGGHPSSQCAGQCAGLDTALLGMGKVHNRETASAGTGIAGRFSPTPLCLTWSVM